MLLVLSTMIISCNSDDNVTNVIEQNPYEKYKGKYKGQYTGEDSGEWEVTITNHGVVSGTVHSLQFNLTFQLDGQIDTSGNIDATYQYNNQNAGSLNATIKGSLVTGTWINTLSNLSGTLSGKNYNN